MIQQNFQGPARARALGFYGAVVAGGVAVGQAAGGLLVSAGLFGSGWRSVFLVNVPIGVLLLAVAPRTLPADRPRGAAPLDLPGLLVLSAAVSLFVLPLVLGHDLGWPAWTFAALICSALLGAVFVAVERRVAAGGGHPLLSVSALRAPGLRPAAAVLMLAMCTWGGFLFTTTLHLQGGLGLSPLRSGLAFVPCVAAFALVGLTWQRLPAGWAVRVVPAGPAVTGVAYLFLGPTAGGGVAYALVTALVGLGLGVMSIIMTVGLAHVPIADAADASGLLLTVMQLGLVVGVSTVGTVFFGLAGDGGATRHAEHGTGWVLAALALCAAATALLLIRASRPASAPGSAVTTAGRATKSGDGEPVLARGSGGADR
ncbi:Major facilitator superfamily MFS_1 (fragment) [Frankia canadensis]|uniref:Major facilitator superfamily MFS_1 n=1 Tax=Frankia canadensis TaxID=1836972 RepID=A0A2I2L1V1_9ACTN